MGGEVATEGVVVNTVVTAAEKIVGRAVLGPDDFQRPAWLRVAVLVTPVPFALGILSISLSNGHPIVLIAGIVMLAMIAGLTFGAHKLVAPRLLEGKSETERTHSYEFDANGYAIFTSVSSARVAWSNVYGYAQTERAFLLLPNPTVSLIIPKRAFRDEDVVRLQALLAAHLKDRNPHPAVKLLPWVVLLIAFIGMWRLVLWR